MSCGFNPNEDDYDAVMNEIYTVNTVSDVDCESDEVESSSDLTDANTRDVELRNSKGANVQDYNNIDNISMMLVNCNNGEWIVDGDKNMTIEFTKELIIGGITYKFNRNNYGNICSYIEQTNSEQIKYQSTDDITIIFKDSDENNKPHNHWRIVNTNKGYFKASEVKYSSSDNTIYITIVKK